MAQSNKLYQTIVVGYIHCFFFIWGFVDNKKKYRIKPVLSFKCHSTDITEVLDLQIIVSNSGCDVAVQHL